MILASCQDIFFRQAPRQDNKFRGYSWFFRRHFQSSRTEVLQDYAITSASTVKKLFFDFLGLEKFAVLKRIPFNL